MGSARKQSGVALGSALVLMLVLTLLAASALQMSRLDLATANSVGDHRKAFELAEAGINAGLASLPSLAPDAPSCGLAPPLPVPLPAEMAAASGAWLCQAGRTPALTDGSSLAALTLWHYEVIAEGRHGNAISVHRQAAWLTAPSTGNPP